eukprot:7389288-Prymnesium_polylepis.3
MRTGRPEDPVLTCGMSRPRSRGSVACISCTGGGGEGGGGSEGGEDGGRGEGLGAVGGGDAGKGGGGDGARMTTALTLGQDMSVTLKPSRVDAAAAPPAASASAAACTAVLS